jgi:hypothetical protein
MARKSLRGWRSKATPSSRTQSRKRDHGSVNPCVASKTQSNRPGERSRFRMDNDCCGLYDQWAHSLITFKAVLTGSGPCLRVSEDGSDRLGSLLCFSCPAPMGRRPTALPRTIAWLPQLLRRQTQATGSIILISATRSNVGTCARSDNLSKKQFREINQQLLPVRSWSVGSVHQHGRMRRQGCKRQSVGMSALHPRRMPVSALLPLNHNRRRS